MPALGVKLQKTITMPLTALYNGSVGTLALLLDEVQHHMTDSGWNQDLLTISDQHVPAMQHHLITIHRLLTLKNICHHAMQYIWQPTHMAQDAAMMFAFLCNSLTSDAHAQVTLEADKYTIDGSLYKWRGM